MHICSITRWHRIQACTSRVPILSPVHPASASAHENLFPACRCGYTGQYKGLQALSDKYAAQGLVVLGLPSNDFAGQEPGSDTQIKNFCESGFQVDFPLFAKTGVSAANANPLHAALTRATGERPAWNFHKYLIDRSGTRALSFPSRVEPQSKQMVQAIESLLKATTAAATLSRAEK
ncbi:MAG: hypothetical protein B7X81_00780 [Hydrogenophilales bacterium 17-61-76]|nr:MAG: hypothetical protein B7X81_00780 [Hydrogenophilales bacterium 17-61-76]